MTGCLFCRWADDPDQRLVCRNHSALFLQNDKWQGALLGSGVIVPIRHAETVFDLTADEVQATFQLLADVKSWMDDRYRPDGYNVGWNCGAVGGQEIMHAHLHVIPRFAQEPSPVVAFASGSSRTPTDGAESWISSLSFMEVILRVTTNEIQAWCTRGRSGM